MITLACAAVSGCAAHPRAERGAPFAEAALPPPLPAEVQAALRDTPAGRSARIDAGPWGTGVTLTPGAPYPAASGFDCRPFTVSTADWERPALACRQADGDWARVRVLHVDGRPLMEDLP